MIGMMERAQASCLSPIFFVLSTVHIENPFTMIWSCRLRGLDGHRARRDRWRRQMLVEHALQVHRERGESLRTPLRHGCQRGRPGVEEAPEARLGTEIVARLAPFLDDLR